MSFGHSSMSIRSDTVLRAIGSIALIAVLVSACSTTQTPTAPGGPQQPAMPVFGDIFSMVEYNGSLVAGGVFDSIAGVPMRNLAVWDGNSWTEFGGGGSGFISNLCVFSGDLIVAGWFDSIGGQQIRNIARWDGQRWHVLGGGLTFPPSGAVGALITFGPELYVGGQFTGAGGVTVTNVAKWDGSSWQSVGDYFSIAVIAFAEVNGVLYASGHRLDDSTGWQGDVARWTGAAWESLGRQPLHTSSFRLVGYGGELFATEVGKKATFWEVPFYRRDDTGWVELAYSNGISSMIIYEGDLYIGSGITQRKGVAAENGPTIFDGRTFTPTHLRPYSLITAMADYEGVLFACARSRDPHYPFLSYIAMWDGRVWDR